MTQAELEHGVGEVLIEESSLQQRIVELGAEISADYAGRDLLLVGVLKGAVFFMADLMRELTVPCEIDFMAISSYGAATDSSGDCGFQVSSRCESRNRSVARSAIVDPSISIRTPVSTGSMSSRPAAVTACATACAKSALETVPVAEGISGRVG